MNPLRTAEQLASLARFVARREQRERDDTAALAQLARTPVPLAAGLEIEWLGTAGYRLTFEDKSLLIDPYLTRIPLREVFGSAPALPDPATHERFLDDRLGDVAGILIGHTHFDHAIDVPLLARSLDCRAYGSDSLARLMRLHGLGERAVEIELRHPYELGPFTVRFFPTLHSKLLLGYKVPFDGALSCEHLEALSPSAYKCGAIYGIHIEVAGTTLYHQGSANLIDDEVPRGGVDVFLAGIAGRSFTESYWQRILPRLEPSVVMANHFDDFFRPLESSMGFSTNVNLSALADEVASVSRDIAVGALEPLRSVSA